MTNTRNLLFSIAFSCFAALAVAMYLQHGMGMLPCPLCVIQRYLFLAVGLAALLGVMTGLPKSGAAVALLGSLGGLGVAGKHLYVLAHPGLSCGIDPMETVLNEIASAKYLPYMFRADGLCENATAPVLGLSIPQWSFACFAVLSVLLIWIVARRK